MAVKKTAAAKKKTTAKKSPASKKVEKPTKGKRGGFNREINDETGFVVGTDQDVIASTLLEGGESRADIVAKVEKKVETETRNGTPKMLNNMVSGVLNKMVKNGYIVESSFILLPPTPASKRAATRNANAKAKEKEASSAKTSKGKKSTAKTTAKKKTTKKKK